MQVMYLSAARYGLPSRSRVNQSGRSEEIFGSAVGIHTRHNKDPVFVCCLCQLARQIPSIQKLRAVAQREFTGIVSHNAARIDDDVHLRSRKGNRELDLGGRSYWPPHGRLPAAGTEAKTGSVFCYLRR